MAADPRAAKTDAALLDTYLRHLTIERGLSSNSLGAYRRDLAKYLEWLEARGLGSVSDASPADVSAFLVRLREGEGLAASSVSRALSVSSSFWVRSFITRWPGW